MRTLDLARPSLEQTHIVTYFYTVELDLRRKEWSMSSNGNKLGPASQIAPGTEVFPAVSLFGAGASISLVDLGKFPAFYPTASTRFTGTDLRVSKSGGMVVKRSSLDLKPSTAVLAGGVTVVGEAFADAVSNNVTRWSVKIGPRAKDVIVGVVDSQYDASKHGDLSAVSDCFGYHQQDGNKSNGPDSSESYGPSYNEGDKITG